MPAKSAFPTTPHPFSTARESAAWLPTLDAAGVPWFEAPTRLVYAASMLNEFTRKCARPVKPGSAARSVAEQTLPLSTGGTLDELQSKICLEAYGIATPKRMFIAAAEENMVDACTLQFPVALKVVSADLPHKTEAGGVRIGIPEKILLKQMCHG